MTLKRFSHHRLVQNLLDSVLWSVVIYSNIVILYFKIYLKIGKDPFVFLVLKGWIKNFSGRYRSHVHVYIEIVTGHFRHTFF